VFLLVPAHSGSPGQKAVKRLLIFIVLRHHLYINSQRSVLLTSFFHKSPLSSIASYEKNDQVQKVNLLKRSEHKFSFYNVSPKFI